MRGGFSESPGKHGNTDIASFCGARTELRRTSVLNKTALVQKSFTDFVYAEGRKVSFLAHCATCSANT